MTQTVPAKVVASATGLGAFIVAILAGLDAGNPTETVLSRAVLSLLACYVVGLIVGGVAERAVAERIHAYVEANRIDDARPSQAPSGLGAGVGGVGGLPGG